MKQLEIKTITDQQSVPFNVAGTGTVTTHGIAIVGTGTLFDTEMKAGSYLVNMATNEAIKVYRKDSNTVAFLEKPFASDLTAVTPQIIAWNKAKVKMMSISATGTIEIDGVAVTDVTITAKHDGNDRSSRPDLIEPVVVDATGGSALIEILYY